MTSGSKNKDPNAKPTEEPERAPSDTEAGDQNVRTTQQATKAVRASQAEPLDTAELEASGTTDAIEGAEQRADRVLRRRRSTRKDVDAPKFEILFNGVGPHAQGEVVEADKLGADEASRSNLLAIHAIKARWGDEEDEEE